MTADLMTPFEKRLASELRRYVDRSGLVTDPADVVSGVVSRHKQTRRPWLAFSAAAAAVVVVVGVVAAAQLLDGMASHGAQAATATVDGLGYSVSVGRDLLVDDSNLAPHGMVESTNYEAFAVGATTYTVDGVPATVALVVRADPSWRDDNGATEFFILWRDGAWAASGLCPFMDPHGPGTPDECRSTEGGP
jgi:hypothetical protein